MRAVLLRVAATAATLVALLWTAGYVAANPKPAAAPLQPPVVVPPVAPPEQTATGRVRLAPSVRATSLPAVTVTHVS
jgi:hypothetical protein